MGEVRGKVFILGKIPEEKPIEAMRNSDCLRLHDELPKTTFYVIGPGKELADVYVRLIGDNLKGHFEPSTNPVVINQAGCSFEPYVVGIQAGQPLQVMNSDPVMHNVHFSPVVAGNKESNKAQMPKSQPFLYQFDQPELFLKLKCDVHPWMFAYVTVESHPFFAVTGKDGSFAITNVPPGEYSVEVRHRKLGSIRREITVHSQEGVAVSFRMQAGQ
jgi:plastocyanin